LYILRNESGIHYLIFFLCLADSNQIHSLVDQQLNDLPTKLYTRENIHYLTQYEGGIKNDHIVYHVYLRSSYNKYKLIKCMH
jgi:hypothetical protein